MFLYKKWNFLILLNNLILSDFLAIQNKIFYLPFDFYKFYFFNYSKTTQNQQMKLFKIKNYYNWKKSSTIDGIKNIRNKKNPVQVKNVLGDVK